MESSPALIDVLWLTLCCVLVLLMQAGFLCLESGLTRSKNSINVAMKNAADFVLAVFIFWLFGFGLMFGDSQSGWLGTDLFLLDLGQSESWTSVFFLFQAMFCATAATIVAGAVAERIRFNGYILLTLLIVALIYPVSGHWVWAGAFAESDGWLASLGFVDFAGSTVVHSVGGWVALAALIKIGPRKGRFVDGKPQQVPASNVPLAFLGVLFFSVGWIGFNGGSTLAFSEQVPGIIANTIIASLAGAIVAYILTRRTGEFVDDPLVVPMNGFLSGLVAITAGCHAVSSAEAAIIGAVGSFVAVYVDRWMIKSHLDDAIGAIPVHLSAGIWGTLAVALFADLDILGTGLGRFEQLQTQLTGVVVVGAWSFTMGLIGVNIINRIKPLRVSEEEEEAGLNVSEHGARTDLIDLLNAMEVQQESADINVRVPVEPFTEVGSIARRYNQVMESLAQAIKQTQSIVRDIKDGVVTFGDDGVLTSFNPGAEKVFGVSSTDAVGQPLLTLVNDGSRRFANRHILDFIPLEKTTEVVARKYNREPFHIEVTVTRGIHEGASQYTALCRDISERKRMEQQLFREREQAVVTLSSIADGVITTDAKGRIIFLNAAAEKLTGWSFENALGKQFNEVYNVSRHGEYTAQALIRRVSAGVTVTAEDDTVLHSNITGVDCPVHHTASPIKDIEGTIFGCVVVFHDMTSARELQKKLSYQARHDALTGLLNRTGFESMAASLLDNSTTDGRSHVLGYVDLDQFKLVNDTCGHAAGDELLKQISALIKSRLRKGDTVARLGGDEFGLLLKDCPEEHGVKLADSIREDIQEFRFSWTGKQFSVGASIGLVKIDHQSPSLVRLLSLADSACFAAKDGGRNRVHLYTPDDAELAERHGQMQWVTKIRHALDTDNLRLYYQSICPIDMPNDKGRHLEIFVRMIDKKGQMIPPGAFIPSAERYNLIQEIDLWVVKNALAWLSDLLRTDPGKVDLCALNLSGSSLGDETCLGEVIECMDHYKIPPNKVCFEITETAAISNLQAANNFMSTMKEKGCLFSLDDFGSGLSSFSYLKNLPVDFLKIDGSFIKEIHKNTIDNIMVQSINTIGHEMGLRTIAEFVESREVLNNLESIGVDYVQGYHIDKPQPLESLSGVAVMPR